MEIQNELVSLQQFIISMRKSGYKDTAYAIAELVDNSLQANARYVEVIIIQEQGKDIDSIIIVDNGDGMSAELLGKALGFGQSGREKASDGSVINNDKNGMGKFGMGLPNASISQCRKVEVWSKQLNSEMNYTYLDLDEIYKGVYTQLPEVVTKEVPSKYSKAIFDGKPFSSGTVVVWSNFDQLKWKRPTTLFKKSEAEIGRMYRRFINENNVQVKFKVCNSEGETRHGVLENGLIKANDPLYIMENTSLPKLPEFHADEE